MTDLVSNPFAKFEDKADPSVPTATLQIYQFIDSYVGEASRAEDPRKNDVNRASSATMCVKRRQFQRMGVEGLPLTPRKIVNFFLGDLAERTMLYFIKQGCVGPGKLYSQVAFGEVLGKIQFQGKDIEIYKQHTLRMKLDNFEVTGHADGFGQRNSDGQWELIECKSAANYGFKGFQDDGPEDYLKQSHSIMLTDEARSLNVQSVRYFYLRKETGHLWDRLFSYDDATARKVVKEYRMANRDDAIEPPFDLQDELERKKPTGRKIANFPCTYCPYLSKCHGKFEVEWKNDQWGNKKPIYVFNKETANAV